MITEKDLEVVQSLFADLDNASFFGAQEWEARRELLGGDALLEKRFRRLEKYMGFLRRVTRRPNSHAGPDDAKARAALEAVVEYIRGEGREYEAPEPSNWLALLARCQQNWLELLAACQADARERDIGI